MPSIKTFYRKHSKHWAGHYDGNQKPSFHLRIKHACDLARELGARRVLDAGCGTGHLIAALRDAGIACDGMDLSSDMLRSARERVGADDGIDLVEGNLEKAADYPSRRYDLITAFGVFVHNIDEKKVLDNFRRKLTAEGRLFISFRNPIFSLFTLNEHTLPFYAELLDAARVSSKDRKAAMSYFAAGCRNRYLSRDRSRGFEKDFSKTFSKFHNPFEIGALFERSGLEVEDLVYLNMHPLPPRVMEKTGSRDRASAAMERRLARSWQGMFLASSFLVRARNRGVPAQR
jgi:SAM-dependent methyltransferase